MLRKVTAWIEVLNYINAMHGESDQVEVSFVYISYISPEERDTVHFFFNDNRRNENSVCGHCQNYNDNHSR